MLGVIEKANFIIPPFFWSVVMFIIYILHIVEWGGILQRYFHIYLQQKLALTVLLQWHQGCTLKLHYHQRIEKVADIYRPYQWLEHASLTGSKD